MERKCWRDSPNGDTFVAIVMGSDSDYEKVQHLLNALEKYKIPYTVAVISAHRHEEKLREYVRSLNDSDSVMFIIAVAGMAAHLGGAIAAQTTIPVFGVPVPSGNDPDGRLAKFAMSELPPGIAQVAVLADNVKDNCNRIVNLIARVLETCTRDYSGLSNFAKEANAQKPAQVPYVPGQLSQ